MEDWITFRSSASWPPYSCALRSWRIKTTFWLLQYKPPLYSRRWLRLKGRRKRMWAGKIERVRVGCGPFEPPSLWFFPLTLWLRATLNYLNAWNQFEINKFPRGLIENYDLQYTSGWWSRLRHVVWRHSVFVLLWPF